MQENIVDRFPTDISYGASGGPEYYTDIVESYNGYEQRNINWAEARCRYNVSYGVKTKEQLARLLSFFRSHRGKAISFRFKDWTDYQAELELIAIGDGIKNNFQLIKNYSNINGNEKRIIKKPVKGTVQIYINNKELTENYTVDYDQGVIKFLEAPSLGQAIYASFEFDVPVRFDVDHLSLSLENYGTYSCHQIPLIEVRI